MRKATLFVFAIAISTTVFSQENIVKVNKAQVKSTTLSAKKATTASGSEKTLMADTKKKEKYVKYSSSEFRTQNNIPANFPKYTDTGNIHKDTGNYDVDLKAWIKNNPDKYNEIKETINF